MDLQQISTQLQQQAKEIATLLKVLANENRLLICCALLENPLNVGDLVKKLPHISPSGISQHLHLLKLQGILDSTKHGQNVTYFFKDKRAIALFLVLKDKYCTDRI